MNTGPEQFVPHSIDLSALVRRSVASLYSHLVTRPMGQALRMGIESQIAELGEFCVSVLDFTQVIVLDYSCADEAVAKLVLRYQRDDRPSNAWFLARGVSEQHREPIEEVLSRHNLALAAEVEDEGFTLLGAATEEERDAWHVLQQEGTLTSAQAAQLLGSGESHAASILESLAARRTVFRANSPLRYIALATLLTRPGGRSRD